VLIESVPGLGKTLFVRTLGRVLGCKFGRIQFTADLMPSDITGSPIFDMKSQEFRFHPGPVFTQLLLADEINRAPAKTHAALLEIMQEYRVTVERTSHKLERPFLVLATQNPVESEGTYNLPEAQLDRFMFQIIIEYLTEDQEIGVVRSTTSLQNPTFSHAVTGNDIVEFQRLARRVPVSEPVTRYAVNIARYSRPGSGVAPDFIKKWVNYGASVRAAQWMILGGKVRALMHGRYHVGFEDVRALAHPVLRHRILLNFHAQSERVTTDQIIVQLIKTVPTPKSGL
jgi:MoxR-like ATPase